jgi:hypothetical protein
VTWPWEDSDLEMQAALERIEAKVDSLAAKVDPLEATRVMR